ncbi:hypothetical protein [Coralloluteibacterium stylophorae]|uniref:Uncharacterized protein n=1 Tax=Coralloluteibacterium stylophorae TaxID=1776034 RepID=A0A8J7VX47_9GAMM|nr:hypothetical protein [Coralloluteibacterium stylophorae]MBS7456318.1 hypothetical protein [Coralloluteibacterium stylophorae]
MTEQTHDARPARRRKSPVLPIVALVVAVVLFGLGFWLGRAGPAAEVESLTTELADARAAGRDAQRQQAVVEDWLQLREAQLTVQGAAEELDRRNFGSAEDRIKQAAAALGDIDAEAMGIDRQRLEQLRQRMESITLAVTPDLQPQRERVQQLSAQLDALAPSPERRRAR